MTPVQTQQRCQRVSTLSLLPCPSKPSKQERPGITISVEAVTLTPGWDTWSRRPVCIHELRMPGKWIDSSPDLGERREVVDRPG